MYYLILHLLTIALLMCATWLFPAEDGGVTRLIGTCGLLKLIKEVLDEERLRDIGRPLEVRSAELCLESASASLMFSTVLRVLVDIFALVENPKKYYRTSWWTTHQETHRISLSMKLKGGGVNM